MQIYKYNNNYYYSYNRALLKEKAESIKESWINEAKRKLKELEGLEIKLKTKRPKKGLK